MPRVQKNPRRGTQIVQIVPLLRELTTRKEDLRKARAGDKQAFDRLYRRYFEPIAAFVHRWGLQDADARNIAQAVFKTFLEDGALDRYEEAEGAFRGWLIGVIRNHTRDYVRKTDRHKVGKGKQMFSLDRMVAEDWPEYGQIVAAKDPPPPDDPRLAEFRKGSILNEGLRRLAESAPGSRNFLDTLRCHDGDRERVCLEMNIGRSDFYYLLKKARTLLAAHMAEAIRDDEALEGPDDGSLGPVAAIIRRFSPVKE